MNEIFHLITLACSESGNSAGAKVEFKFSPSVTTRVVIMSTKTTKIEKENTDQRIALARSALCYFRSTRTLHYFILWFLIERSSPTTICFFRSSIEADPFVV